VTVDWAACAPPQPPVLDQRPAAANRRARPFRPASCVACCARGGVYDVSSAKCTARSAQLSPRTRGGEVADLQQCSISARPQHTHLGHVVHLQVLHIAQLLELPRVGVGRRRRRLLRDVWRVLCVFCCVRFRCGRARVPTRMQQQSGVKTAVHHAVEVGGSRRRPGGRSANKNRSQSVLTVVAAAVNGVVGIVGTGGGHLADLCGEYGCAAVGSGVVSAVCEWW
jgi:hypothetical protein